MIFLQWNVRWRRALALGAFLIGTFKLCQHGGGSEIGRWWCSCCGGHYIFNQKMLHSLHWRVFSKLLGTWRCHQNHTSVFFRVPENCSGSEELDCHCIQCSFVSWTAWKKKKSLNIETIFMPTSVEPCLCLLPFSALDSLSHWRKERLEWLVGWRKFFMYVRSLENFQRNGRPIFFSYWVSTTSWWKTETATFLVPRVSCTSGIYMLPDMVRHELNKAIRCGNYLAISIPRKWHSLTTCCGRQMFVHPCDT